MKTITPERSKQIIKSALMDRLALCERNAASQNCVSPGAWSHEARDIRVVLQELEQPVKSGQ